MTNPYQARDLGPEVSPLPGDTLSRRVVVRPIARLQDAWNLIYEQYLLFVGICFVALLINGVAQGLLVGPLACGVYLCFDARMNRQWTTFDRMFKGFDFFAPSFLATLIMWGWGLLLAVPLAVLFFVAIGVSAVLAESHPNVAGLAFTLGLVPFTLGVVAVSLAIYVPFVFVFPLIVDRRMKAWQAVKTSWEGARKNLGGIVGMFLVYGVLAMASALMCYVPVFFLMPLQIVAFFLLYRDVFPNAAPERIDGQNVHAG